MPRDSANQEYNHAVLLIELSVFLYIVISFLIVKYAVHHGLK